MRSDRPPDGGHRLGRIRRALDGIGIGIGAFLTAWLLVFARLGLRGAGLTCVLVLSIGIAAVTVTGLRAARHRRASLLCAAGAALSISGTAGLTLALDYFLDPGWVLLTGSKQNVDHVLQKLGASVTERTDHSNLFFIGNLRTGLWKKAFGLAKPDELVKVVQSVVDDRG